VSGAGVAGTGPQFFYVPSENLVLSPAKPVESSRPAVVEKKAETEAPVTPVKVSLRAAERVITC
jgi:hypothetical protein